MPDRHLDDLIILALDSQAMISSRQKAIAWDRLQRRASASVQWVEQTPRRLSWRAIEAQLQSLRRMLLTEDIYNRAARHRHRSGKGLPLTGDFTFHYYPLYHLNLDAT